MTRTLTNAVTTELAKDNIRAALLAFFDFDSGAVRFWTGVGDLVWNGETFTGAGDLGSVSAIEETTQTKAVGVTYTLSGVNSALISVALDEHYQGRTNTLWLAFFDEDGALIDDPVQVLSGRMDMMRITDDGETATIQVSVESRLVDLDRPNEARFYTDQDQQAHFAGDKGFEFVPAMQDKLIMWGKELFVGGPRVSREERAALIKSMPRGGDYGP